LGTSSGSRIFANDVRGGEPGIPGDVALRDFPEFELLLEPDLPELETAKMRPSKDY
jgi:hypothetical protein